MTRLRAHLRSFVWLALVAMSALAFGPSVSRALGVEVVASSSMPALCSGMGTPAAMASQMQMPTQLHMHAQMQMQMQMPAPMQMAPATGHPSDGPAPPHHSSNLLDCCALCAIAASPMVVLAIALPEWQPGVASTPFLGSASGAVPRQRAQWPSAAPRGPPLLA